MFGEGTNRKNNKKPYFPVTGGSALDNGGRINNARHSIHGAPNRMVEDTRTRQSIHGAPNRMVEDT